MAPDSNDIGAIPAGTSEITISYPQLASPNLVERACLRGGFDKDLLNIEISILKSLIEQLFRNAQENQTEIIRLRADVLRLQSIIVKDTLPE